MKKEELSIGDENLEGRVACLENGHVWQRASIRGEADYKAITRNVLVEWKCARCGRATVEIFPETSIGPGTLWLALYHNKPYSKP